MSLQETCRIMSIAIQNGDLETVRNLIEEQGFPVDQRMYDSGGETPFSKAASSGHVSIAEYLLNKGAYIDNRNSKTNTPLMISAFHGHKKMVVFLLLRGADPFATGADNYTADAWARANNNTHVSNLIINFTKHGVAALNTDDVTESQTDIWNKTSNDEIEHIYYRQNGQLRMTDIFNFADKERTRLYARSQHTCFDHHHRQFFQY